MLRLITIFLMEVLSGAEVDLFIPSFPDLQDHFNLSPFMVELTLGVNFVAYCIASLIVGQLADRYGRRQLILGGLLTFIVGSFFCVYAGAYWHLLFGRFLQGLGIAAPAVLAFVIVADTYPLAQQQKLMGVLNGAIGLAMSFAPVVGSYVNLFFGWEGNFFILLSLGVICLSMGFFWIPPHHIPEHKKKPVFIFKDYLPLFTLPKPLLFMMTITFLIVPYWSFIGIAPILYMDGMGVPLEHFGYYQGALAFTFSIISLTSGFWLKAFGTTQSFYASLTLCIFTTILIFFIALFNLNHPLLITLVLMGWSAGLVLPINILYPLALESLEDAKGKMAAAIQATRLIFTAIGLQFVGYIYQGTFRPIAFVMILSICLGLYGIYLLITKYRLRLGHESAVAPLHS